MSTSTLTIDPAREYELMDVVRENLIPDISTHQMIYRLVMARSPEDGKRHPVSATTAHQIKPIAIKRVGAKNWELKILGAEIIQFLTLNNLQKQ